MEFQFNNADSRSCSVAHSAEDTPYERLKSRPIVEGNSPLIKIEKNSNKKQDKDFQYMMNQKKASKRE
jgi:hypothetical protein